MPGMLVGVVRGRLSACSGQHPGRAATPTAIAPFCPNEDGGVLFLLPTWVPDLVIRRKILVENPARQRQRQPRPGATCLRIASMTWAL